uniref:Uncharacterized protein n=1 Tax=Sus scrofa TaxID=9823 RepID=A0A8D0U831_PIG
MPPTPEQPSGPMEEPLALAASSWPPLPCGPCVPIMLVLAALAAVFLLTTAVLAERLFRRSLRPDPGTLAPTLVWRPGGELWIEPTGTPRERSEDWYGSSVPLLMDRAPDPPTLGGTLEARATAPPAPNSPRNSLVPQTPTQAPARSTFWRPQVWEERPGGSGQEALIPSGASSLGSPWRRSQLSGGVKAGPAWVFDPQGLEDWPPEASETSESPSPHLRASPPQARMPLPGCLLWGFQFLWIWAWAAWVWMEPVLQRSLEWPLLSCQGLRHRELDLGPALGLKLPKSHSELRTQGTRQAGNSTSTLLQQAPKMPAL